MCPPATISVVTAKHHRGSRQSVALGLGSAHAHPSRGGRRGRHGFCPDCRPTWLRRTCHRRLRPVQGAARGRDERFRPGGPARCARRAGRRRAACRAQLRRADERHRSAVRDAAVPGRAPGSRPLPGHGHVAVPSTPGYPYSNTGVKLGDEQFALASEWEASGKLALVGIGVEPGLSDVFARHAADTMFSAINQLGVRDGASLEVAGYDFAPTFSIWTTIEECLNPPVIWEKSRGWYTTPPFSEPEVFNFPAGIGPVECVNVEHEEVLLMPRWIPAQRVTFKYGLGSEFIDVLQTLHKLGLDSVEPVRAGGASVSPRDVVAACLPDPATLGDRMTGLTCAGTWVTGTGKDGKPREVYLHHVVDNAWSMAEYGSQAVVWQTAVNPVVALELIDSGAWSGCGVLGPEALPASPFLELLTDYGSPWACEERTLASK